MRDANPKFGRFTVDFGDTMQIGLVGRRYTRCVTGDRMIKDDRASALSVVAKRFQFANGFYAQDAIGLFRNTSAATFVRVHGQVRPRVAGASRREDVVHRAGFTVGERLCGELLSCCSGTSCWNGKRSTRCSRPRCSSFVGGSTTTRSDRTVPLGIVPRLPRRGSPVRSPRLCLGNRTGRVCWRANPSLRNWRHSWGQVTPTR